MPSEKNRSSKRAAGTATTSCFGMAIGTTSSATVKALPPCQGQVGSRRETTRHPLLPSSVLVNPPDPSRVLRGPLVHVHKRLGRGSDLAELAEQLRAADDGLELLTGELQGYHARDRGRRS